MNSCQGKKIIITGGGTGYGYGAAKVLAQAGAEVTITGRREEVLKKAADELGVKYVAADITKGSDWNKVFESVGNRVDVLINNAGAGVKIAPLAQQTDDEIIESVDINLIGALLGCRRAAQIMTEQRSGLIVNVTSLCSHYAWPGWTAYCAAKAGVDMFSRALYTELRPYGVRVSVLTLSGGADTEFRPAAGMEKRPAAEAAKMTQPDQFGDLLKFICTYHDSLEFQEIIVQPVAREIIPL